MRLMQHFTSWQPPHQVMRCGSRWPNSNWPERLMAGTAPDRAPSFTLDPPAPRAASCVASCRHTRCTGSGLHGTPARRLTQLLRLRRCRARQTSTDAGRQGLAPQERHQPHQSRRPDRRQCCSAAPLPASAPRAASAMKCTALKAQPIAPSRQETQPGPATRNIAVGRAGGEERKEVAQHRGGCLVGGGNAVRQVVGQNHLAGGGQRDGWLQRQTSLPARMCPYLTAPYRVKLLINIRFWKTRKGI